MLRRRNRKIVLTARELPEREQDRIVERPGKLTAAELSLAGGAGDGHGVSSVGHEISLRHAELDAQVGVGESRTFDDALSWIVIDIQPFDLAEEDIAVADSGAEAARCPCLGQR